jgi:hypothetical protein
MAESEGPPSKSQLASLQKSVDQVQQKVEGAAIGATTSAPENLLTEDGSGRVLILL